MLARVAGAADGAGAPLFAWQRYGAGTSFWLGFDEAWRWRAEVGDKYHYKFYGQVVRFLSLQSFTRTKRFFVTTDKSEYNVGEEVRVRAEIRDPEELPERASTSTVESQVQDRLAVDRFEMALRELDSVSRSIVVLREVEGLAYDEICEVLQLPMPTVKTRLLRARRQLAVALEGWQP